MACLTYLLLILTTLFWGGTFIAGRLLAGNVPPEIAAFLRFFIATASLLPILLLNEGWPRLPSRKQSLALVFLGLSGVFTYNILFFTGLTHISAGRASLIIAVTPLVIFLLSVALTKEQVGIIKIIGVLISLTGAVFVISNGRPAALFSGGFGPGEQALLGCVLSWSAYTMVGRVVLTALSPLVTVFYACLAGTCLLAAPALAGGLLSLLPEIELSSWFSLAYLGIFGTAVGFSWYYSGVKQIGASRAGVFINLVPVFGTLLSWLVLDELLRPSVLIGGALVISGVYLTNKKVRSQTTAARD